MVYIAGSGSKYKVPRHRTEHGVEAPRRVRESREVNNLSTDLDGVIA